jgi:hypothetical protein
LQGIKATEGSFGTGTGVLIGMDIIGQGDFAISNYEGRTKFSFRIPTLEHIELTGIGRTKSPEISQKPHLGRNDPCYCGSGKKYKKCHGKTVNFFAVENKQTSNIAT